MDYSSKLDQTSWYGRNSSAVGLALMTRNKPVETEVVEGAGASARLVLVLKAGTKSGYAGVTPNGKQWRAHIYKAAKKQ